ncbi:MAG: EamA family transporter, partial [Acidimicrobiales bacterium]|nr:EamA family transporter [Acidimicrobiales bacterium]
LAYPLARGGGALLAALGGALLLGDVLGLGQWVAIAVVGGGLLSLVGKGATRASVAWALFTAATIATYTLIDAEGARSSTSAVSYGFALMVFAGAAITVANVVRGRTPDLVAVARAQCGRWVVGGAAIAVAYTMVLVAITMAPVGYVTMLRESSVVLGALAGWLFLHERMGRHRVVSSCVIAAGLVLLIALSA